MIVYSRALARRLQADEDARAAREMHTQLQRRRAAQQSATPVVRTGRKQRRDKEKDKDKCTIM